MSWSKYEDGCTGCEPVALNPATGQVLHEATAALKRVWEGATHSEREAFHNVCCNNDTSPGTMAAVAPLHARFEAAFKAMDGQGKVGLVTDAEKH